MWASDNQLTGGFKEIHLWGPISSALSNLTAMIDLILRNDNISDTLPSTIGECQSLTVLDLSFNNITGRMLNSLFNLSSLAFL
ncbi:hypothetical protein Scep_001792 [Stephania cephalantha]|uniref:Uncharacterized protein n=1 Tax=Stephania cephalantha TaxID=152367 RepID=A0AAP0Q842_9MAGN